MLPVDFWHSIPSETEPGKVEQYFWTAMVNHKQAHGRHVQTNQVKVR
jgi:hypothetical protein